MARLKRGEVARNVACLVWEEDLQKDGKSYGDLLAFCEGLNIPCAVSPWHDHDRYTPNDVSSWVDRHIDPDFYDFISNDITEVRALAPAVGDFKKSHAHILVKNSGPRNRDYFTKLFAPFVKIAPSKWEKVDHLEAYICYLCHKNTPSKHRYSEMDVHGFGGIDLSPLIKIDKMERFDTMQVIKARIAKGDLRYYFELDEWATSTKDANIMHCVEGRVSYFQALFRSRRQKRFDDAQAAKERAGCDSDAS